MERNTITTLGQLREGDRFTYPRRVDVWQVTGFLDSQCLINQFSPGGTKIHPYDSLKKKNTMVKFLRHTKPEPGEQCLLKDLKIGDVFYTGDDVITEYTVQGEAAGKYWLTFCSCNGKYGEIHGDEIVTLVSRFIPA
jgi:hypothetical protein